MNRRQSIVLVIAVIALAGAAVVLAWLNRPAPHSPPPEIPRDPQASAYERLVEESLQRPELYIERGVPRTALIQVEVPGASPVERARAYLDQYQDLYLQNDPYLGLEILRTAGEAGEAVVLQQTYRGLPVYGGEITVLTSGSQVRATAGHLLPAGLTIETAPALSNGDAEAIARSAMGDLQAPIFGRTRLVIFDASFFDEAESNPRLGWRVTVGDREQWIVVVDALDGSLLFQHSLIPSHTGGYDLDLEDANGTNSQDTNCFWNTNADDQLGDETGLFPHALSDPEAVALWGWAGRAYRFYHDTYNRHSYDGDDGQLELYLHAPNNGGAQWIGASIDCDLIQFSDGYVSYDVMVHEFTHGVIDFTSNLIYKNQSGALNESYADIMAAIADDDWIQGSFFIGGRDPSRSLANPPLYGQPDHVKEYVWTTSDHGGVHSNSGIPNYVAYLIAEGGTHPDSGVEIKGQGRGVVSSVYYTTMALLPSNAMFHDARAMTIGITNLNYGPFVVCQVRNAFYAVGIGDPDINCDGQEDDPDLDGDNIRFGLDNCPNHFNPLQVDLDGDGLGSGCDLDDNGNNVPDALDTQLANPYLLCPTPGVACDLNNFDGDQWPNDQDNCVFVQNDDQADVDGDGEGDACDPDADGDGWSNNNDNCPFTPNPDQANQDGDFAGDACDPTPDCADVNGWSTGATIQTLEGEVSLPPKPIQDSLACLNWLSVGQAALDPSALQLAPDGKFHRFEISPGADRYLHFPLPGCPEDDPERWLPEYRGQVILRRLAPGIRAWVADDAGFSVTSGKSKGDVQGLLYGDQGRGPFTLVMALFLGDSDPDPVLELSLRCGLKKDLEVPAWSSPPADSTPEPETATPAPTPTPTATATPTVEPGGLAAPRFSADRLYFRGTSCGPKELAIEVQRLDPAVQSVVLFFRLKNNESGETSGWTATAMGPIGNGWFSHKLRSEVDIPDFLRFPDATLQVQFVATSADGSELYRTEVLGEVKFMQCSG